MEKKGNLKATREEKKGTTVMARGEETYIREGGGQDRLEAIKVSLGWWG